MSELFFLANSSAQNETGYTMFKKAEISDSFDPNKRIVVFPGDCLQFLRGVPDRTFQLIVTSPPYNIGKEYEKRTHLNDYIAQQGRVIQECVRVLKRSRTFVSAAPDAAS